MLYSGVSLRHTKVVRYTGGIAQRMAFPIVLFSTMTDRAQSDSTVSCPWTAQIVNICTTARQLSSRGKKSVVRPSSIVTLSS